MALRIGEAIDARRLERETSGWNVEAFTAMCDVLIWASTRGAYGAMPSFTGRVNAPDGGIDAEWEIERSFVVNPNDDPTIAVPVVVPGWNVWQYKLRSIANQDRRRIVADLKRSLQGAVVAITAKHGRSPDRYVVIVNLDLTHSQGAILREAILKGLEAPEAIDLQIIDAGMLAAIVNDQPHIRAAFFLEDRFATWHLAMDRHRRIYSAHGWTNELVGRNALLAELCEAVDSPDVRAILISGPPASGKSRLVLEATRHRRELVAVALDVRSMPIAELRTLGHPSHDVIIIVDDAAPEQVEELIALTLSEPNLKVIIVAPSLVRLTAPSFAIDHRVRCFAVPALDDASSTELLEAVGVALGTRVTSWIVQQAGGIPGILLSAASLGASPHDEALTLRQQIAIGLKQRIRAQLGEEALTTLRVLAPLTFVGYKGERYGSELDRLIQIVARDIEVPTVRLRIPDLSQAGLVAEGGSFVNVTVPLLAEELTREWLASEPHGPVALFASKSESVARRFIDRIAQMDPNATRIFWEMLFEPAGPLNTLGTALTHPALLRRAATAVPQRVLDLLKDSLDSMSFEERMALVGDRRRELVWTIESLILHPEVSAHAVRMMWLLAEAETETWGNNATALLADVFEPLHPYVPLELAERLAIASRLFDRAPSDSGRLVLIRALGRSFGNRFMMLMGNDWPLRPYERESYMLQDLRYYYEERARLLFCWAEHPSPSVKAEALAALTIIAKDLVLHGMSDVGFAAFERLVDAVLDSGRPLDAGQLSATLMDLRTWLVRAASKDEKASQRTRNEFALATTDSILQRLQGVDLLSRLQVWAGRWEHDEMMAASTAEPAPFVAELERVADTFIEDPKQLAGETLTWLLSPAAGKGMYFFELLGRRDTGATTLPTIVAHAATDSGASAFGAYFSGWTKRDGAAARAALDRLAADSPAVVMRAVAYATVLAGPSESDIRRLIDMVERDQVDVSWVSRWLGSMGIVRRWIDGTKPTHFEALLHTLAGTPIQHADGVIALLSSWWSMHESFTDRMQGLGWACLTSPHAGQTTSEPWQHDLLASYLAQEDPERGFALLEDLMTRELGSFAWEPLDERYGHALWDVLSGRDRVRLIRLALKIASVSNIARMRMTQVLHDSLGDDQEIERAVLIAEGTSDIMRARIVAEALNSKHPELMWSVAFALVETFPDDEKLLRRLTDVVCGRQANAIGSTFMYWGSYTPVLADRLRDIERALATAPLSARQWLRDVRSRLDTEIERQIVWEYDEDVDDLRTYLDDPASPRRSWAVHRVLKYADWKDARRLLSLDDIIAAMPEIDLPDAKRKALEAAIPVWLGER